jgi:hypothetical protein
MKAAAIMTVLALGLAACDTIAANEAGTADYDALKRATDECKAQGGTLVLKDQGDAQRIDAYVCKKG